MKVRIAISACSLVLTVMMIGLVIGCSSKKPVPPVSKPGEAPYYTKLVDAQAAAADSQLIVVKFSTDWCYWCKVMDTGVFAHQEAIDAFTNDMILAKVNAEVDTALAARYHVSGYPTTVLMHKDGSEIDRVIGYQPCEEFLKTLADYKVGIGTLQNLVHRAETEADRELYSEIAYKYKYSGGREEAVTWFEKVINMGDPLDSLSGDSRIALADMYRRAKEYDQALAAFQAVAKDFTGMQTGIDAEIYTGLVYKSMGDTANAIAAFNKVAEEHPNTNDGEYASELAKQLMAPSEETE